MKFPGVSWWERIRCFCRAWEVSVADVVAVAMILGASVVLVVLAFLRLIRGCR